MDLAVTTTDYGADDLSWLGSAHGFEAAPEITLVADDFLSVWTDGRLPSGVCLALLTSGTNAGRYGKYAGRAGEVQTITRTATGGTVAITWDGNPTAPVDTAVVAATTAAQIKAALLTMGDLDEGDVTVTGSAGGPFVVTFGGRYVGTDVPPIVIDATNATGGTVTVAQTTAGGSTAVEGRDVFAGHLKKGVKLVAAHMVGAALFRHGQVIEANLPANHGLDAAAKVAVAGRIDYR